jgi:hypothetical protein
MEAIQSNTGPSAIEYVLTALCVTLLLSVYLAGGSRSPDNTWPRTLAASMRNQNTLRFAIEGAGRMRPANLAAESARLQNEPRRARRGLAIRERTRAGSNTVESCCRLAVGAASMGTLPATAGRTAKSRD